MRLRHIPGCEEFIRNSRECISGEAAFGCKGAWRQLFGNDREVQIEIGMGKGQFIRAMAGKNPHINYIGIERYETVLMKAIQRKRKEEAEGAVYENLRFLCLDAAALHLCFAPGEVDAIFLNFSDPWPKARHAQRRLTSRNFMGIYDKILKPEGCLIFKTDNVDLFTYSLEEIPQAGWELLAQSFDFHAEAESKDNIMTEYEEKFSAKGQKICRLVARREKKE